MPAPTGSPSPVMTLKTPGGKIFAASSAMRSALRGVHSDGFRITQLPAARAGATFQMAIIRG